jgi:hypothetical protein
MASAASAKQPLSWAQVVEENAAEEEAFYEQEEEDPLRDVDLSADTSDPLGLVPGRLGTFSAARRGTMESRTASYAAPDTEVQVNPLHEKFLPSAFLAKYHSKMSYAELLRGLENLEQKISKQTGQLKDLVKGKFDKFVECKDAVETMGVALKRKDFSGAQMTELDHIVSAARDEASHVFDDLLRRKAKAEDLRGALTLLRQFRFLLDLPATIADSLRKHEYDRVVRAYRRVKPMMDQPTVPLFEKVLAEVKALVTVCREQLARQLDDAGAGLDEQEAAVRHLFALDAAMDPGWLLLRHQRDWLSGALQHTVEQFELRARSIRAHAQHHVSVEAASAAAAAEPEIASARLRFMRRMCSMLTSGMTDWVRVATAYFAGKYSKEGGQREPHTVDEFGVFVSAVFTAFATNARQLLQLPSTADPVRVPTGPAAGPAPLQATMAAHLRECLQLLSETRTALAGMPMAEAHVEAFEALLDHARALYIADLCARVRTETVAIVAAAAATVAVTDAPVRVQRVIERLVSDARPLVPDRHALTGRVVLAALESVRVLADCLHQSACADESPAVVSAAAASATASDTAAPALTDTETGPAAMVLAAARQTADGVLNAVCAALVAAFPSARESAALETGRRDTLDVLAALQEIVTQHIVRRAAVAAAAVVRQGLLGDPTEWSAASMPSGALSSQRAARGGGEKESREPEPDVAPQTCDRTSLRCCCGWSRCTARHGPPAARVWRAR